MNISNNIWPPDVPTKSLDMGCVVIEVACDQTNTQKPSSANFVLALTNISLIISSTLGTNLTNENSTVISSINDTSFLTDNSSILPNLTNFDYTDNFEYDMDYENNNFDENSNVSTPFSSSITSEGTIPY